jgi:ABC-2 type transport system permease protein
VNDAFPLAARAFWGLVVRDSRVLAREAVSFALRTLMNPLLFVFVFTYVLPKVGGGGFATGAPTGPRFATVLLPGLIAVSIFFQGIAAVALPLSTELGATREIEDRLMAPIAIWVVALEKICFSAVQSIIAACAVFPLVYWIPAQPPVITFNWPLLVLVVVLASLTAGSMGLVLGTIVPPRQIGLIFSIVVLPVTFLGCVYYPWAALSAVRWLQVGVLINPLVYVSEGLRASLTPGVSHMQVPIVLGAIVVVLVALTWLGIRTFTRRVIT